MNQNSDRLEAYPAVERLTSMASAGILVAMLVAVWLALRLDHGTEDVQRWLPETAPSRVAYAEFTRRFIGTQVLLVAWPGANLDDPRIEQATQALETLRDRNPDWPIVAIVNSKQSIDALRDKMPELTEDMAIRRFAGHAVGKDGSSFITILLSECSPPERDKIIAAAAEVVESLGIDKNDVVLAGEPYQAHLVDVHSRIAVQRYMPISILLSLVVAWWCMRRWRFTIMIMALAGMGQVAGMALISATVGQMGAILIVLPTLLFMLTLSAAVHLMHYYDHACHIGHPHPGVKAIEFGWMPCVVAALTTAFAFLSLGFSDLEPVVQFGWLAAGGMVLTTLVLLIAFVPATRLAGYDRKLEPEPEPVNRLVEWLLKFTCDWCNGIVVAGIILLAFCVLALPKLKSTTRFDGMFEEDHPSIKSLRWVENRLGPIETLEFLVTFPNEPDPIDIIHQLDAVNRLQSEINKHPQIHSTFSATSVMPSMPIQTGSRGTVRRAVYRNRIMADMDRLEAAQLVHSTPSDICWRITARFKTETDAEFHELRSDLETEASQRLNAMFAGAASPPTLEVTGLRMVIETANATLLKDLISSFASAFLLITPFMMLVVRSFWGGLLLMVPNLLPIVFVFAVMSGLGIQLDVASILTASIALGIAVDDTLHCITWYMRGRRGGMTAEDAVALAIHRCIKPMLYTSLICTGAMLPFLFCEFLPTGRFALLLILILFGSLLCDLFLLTALLCSPLGLWVGAPKSPASL